MTPLRRELHKWNLLQGRGVVKEEKEGVALGQPKYPPKEEVQEVFNLKPNQ